MENITRELQNIADELIKLMIWEIKVQDHSASGKLIDSFEYKVHKSKDLIKLSIDNTTDYWQKVDSYATYGRGVSVTESVIYTWILNKKIFAGMSKKQKLYKAKQIIKSNR